MNITPTPPETQASSTSVGIQVLEQVEDRKRRIEVVRRTLEILHPGPDPFFEIRVLEIPSKGRGKPYQASGYFDDYDLAAKAAIDFDDKEPVGLYVTFNRADPSLLARSPNRIVPYLHPTTTDKEIVRRQWLLIDCDPTRPAGISSTDNQHLAARRLFEDAEHLLDQQSFPKPLIGMSGNGYHLLYRIDLPNDAESDALIKRFLESLAGQMARMPVEADLTEARIDRAVFNASRICRLYGTTARKGYPTSDRPHRTSWLGEPPDPIGIVTAEQLKAVADLLPNEQPTGSKIHTPVNGRPKYSRVMIDKWLADRGQQFEHKKKTGDGRDMYVLAQCPFDESHGSRGETIIMQDADGKPSVKCHHDSCSGRGWQQFMQAIGPPDPDHYDPPLRVAKTLKHVQPQSAQPAEQPGTPEPEPAAARIIQLIPSAEFDAADYKQGFLIKKVLVANQPTICGGRSKAMKTSVLIDLAVSLGTGTPFLGQFETVQSSVAVLSGESGQFTVQETARRVAKARGIELRDASVHWGFELPQLARPDDLVALATAIQASNAAVVIIDPAYLCLLGGDTQGRQASNIFDMGPLLLGLTDVGLQTGSTIILCHHCRKNNNDRSPWEPPELEDLSMAGFGEWARQWLLLGRREAYEQGSGHHKLWLNVGGSAGHSGCWGVDIEEGTLADDFTGRVWDVAVNAITDARDDAHRAAQNKRAAKQEQKEAEHCRKLMDAMGQFKDFRTARQLRELTGLNSKDIGKALITLMKDGRTETAELVKRGQPCEGYRLKAV